MVIYVRHIESETRYECDEEIFKQSNILTTMTEEEDDGELPITNMTKEIWEKCLEFMNYHNDKPFKRFEERPTEEEYAYDDFDKEFMNYPVTSIDDNVPMKIMEAADFLQIEDLIHLCAARLAPSVKKILDAIPEPDESEDETTGGVCGEVCGEACGEACGGAGGEDETEVEPYAKRIALGE